MPKKICHKKVKERMQKLVVKLRKPLLVYVVRYNAWSVYTAFLSDGKMAKRLVYTEPEMRRIMKDCGWEILNTQWPKQDKEYLINILRLLYFVSTDKKLVYMDEQFVGIELEAPKDVDTKQK